MKKTVVFDFDGVIHSYKSPWVAVDVIPDEPVEGIRETILQLQNEGYEVVIVSTRCRYEEGYRAMQRWLEKYDIYVDKIMSTKPPAIVYIDDRAICFQGTCEGLVDKIKSFKSWTESQE